MSHKLGCPQRNNLYARCECAEMDIREHTEQLRVFNEHHSDVQTEELRSQLDAVTEERNNLDWLCKKLTAVCDIQKLGLDKYRKALEDVSAGLNDLRTRCDMVLYPSHGMAQPRSDLAPAEPVKTCAMCGSLNVQSGTAGCKACNEYAIESVRPSSEPVRTCGECRKFMHTEACAIGRKHSDDPACPDFKSNDDAKEQERLKTCGECRWGNRVIYCNYFAKYRQTDAACREFEPNEEVRHG